MLRIQWCQLAHRSEGGVSNVREGAGKETADVGDGQGNDSVREAVGDSNGDAFEENGEGSRVGGDVAIAVGGEKRGGWRVKNERCYSAELFGALCTRRLRVQLQET